MHLPPPPSRCQLRRRGLWLKQRSRPALSGILSSHVSPTTLATWRTLTLSWYVSNQPPCVSGYGENYELQEENACFLYV